MRKIVAELADIRKSLEFTAVVRAFCVRQLAELRVDLAEIGSRCAQCAKMLYLWDLWEISRAF